jgi:hypothetical protein
MGDEILGIEDFLKIRIRFQKIKTKMKINLII